MKFKRRTPRTSILWTAISSMPLFSLLAAVSAGSAVSAGAQTIPGAVIYQTKTIASINGNAGHVAANGLGDAFYVSQTDNVAYWLPRGAKTPIALVTGLSGGRNATVDASNNVYISSNYSGRVIEIPYVNGTYATGTVNSSSLPTCGSSVTAPCQQFGNGAGATGYYLQVADVGFDQLGTTSTPPNAYVIDERDNVCNQSSTATTCNSILKFTPSGSGTYTATVVVTGLPQNNGAQIAVGPKGDVYYADGSKVYYVAAGATSYTTIGTGLVQPTGVTTDIYGNLFITDGGSGANKIYEMPQVNGVAQPSQQFDFLNFYSANGVAFDGIGHMFYTGYSGGTNLNQATLYTFNLGSAAVGTAVSSSVTTLNIQFVSAATIGAITPSGSAAGFSYVAGTCAAGAVTAGSTCNFNVNYTPNAVGLQKGAVIFANASGANIATASLSGVGLGAAQTSDPGTVTAIGSGLKNPQGIAVDGSNNVYVADAGNNTVTMYPAGSSTGSAVGSGLVSPTSVALDGAGNLYIGDSGNGRVVEVPNVGGTLTTSAQTVVKSGLGTSLGIATDLNDNLYIADASKNQVLKIGTVGGVPAPDATSTIAISKSVAPSAVATDATGNLFVADTTANTVTEITYYGHQASSIGSSYLHPSGLATDASGSLYVADSGNTRLLRIPYETTFFNTNDQYSVGATVAVPYGVATDSAGNLYVVDSQNATASMINRLQGTLPLGRANINTSSPTLTGYVGSAGNQALTLGNPDYVATGDTSVFSVTSPGTGGCTNSETIAPGFACTLSATFSPLVIGSYSEKLAFSSNAANTATPSLTLTGTGLNLTSSTLTLQSSPSGTVPYGQPITVTATINSSKAGTPTGTVTFFVDGGQGQTVQLTGNTASITLNNLTGGQHAVAASYSGDNSYAPSSSTLTISIGRTTDTVTLTKDGFVVPPSAVPGSSVALTATITPSAKTAPTGTVTFTVGSTTLGTSPIAQVSNTVGGVTTTTYVAVLKTTALPTGTDVVVATYSGDVNYQGATGSLTIIVSPPMFTLSPASASLTVPAGTTATTTLTVTSISGFGGTPASNCTVGANGVVTCSPSSNGTYVGLSCSGLPANATCAFSPNGFLLQADNVITTALYDSTGKILLVPALSAPTKVTLSVITGTTPPVNPPPVGALRLLELGKQAPVSLALLGAAPLAFLLRRRAARRFRRGVQVLSLLVIIFASTMFTGCGAGLQGKTPTGTYNVTVTAVSTFVGYVPTSPAGFAAGCVITPAGSTNLTCTQTATINLAIQ